ncbi:CoA-binding protein [Virgibacillus necropolis]|uniref:CoA-binding protein n=1 Tax=Virgibacillus necropolis TaxID=163877 RepID=UPI00384B8A46
MAIENPSNEKVKQVLQESKNLAVVGLSDNPNRTSYQVSKIMQDKGYHIIPVNPMVDEVLGQKSYASLKDVDEPIDIINVFRRSEYLPAIAEEAAGTKANVFWAQLGIENEEAYAYLKDRDFTVIMDTCIKVAHSMLIK